MGLTVAPVSLADITQLQQGITFTTDAAGAAAALAAINATPPTQTVYGYAVQLLASNISLSQVAMADSALMEGGTIAVGNNTTSNTLTFFTQGLLAASIPIAVKFNLNQTVFAAENLGLALGGNATFNTNFVTGQTIASFAALASAATGVSASAIASFAKVWTDFYTAFPAGTNGLTVTQAAFGAAFGDGVGVALLNPTPIGPANQPPGLPDARFSTLQNNVYNALIVNAEGNYKTGVTLGALPVHIPLLGEAPNAGTATTVFLTPNQDTPTSGFSLTLGGPPIGGFTATLKGTVFNAQPTVTSFGIAVNTLSNGDNLQDTVGDGTLNDTTAALTIGANPTFATNVTMNGLATATITAGVAGVTGFQGNITGITTINMLNSLGAVQVGGTGLGLKTLPTTINVTNPGAGLGNDDALSVIVAQAAADLTKTIAVNLTGGNLGTTAAGGAFEIAISNDLPGPGTAANPNNSFGTWAITANNNTNLVLAQDLHDSAAGTEAEGVGGATALVLAGAGNIAVGSDGAGDWQFLKSIDAGKTTGALFLTGATSGVASQARASAANPGWLFGSEATGLLDDTGAAFNLTSVVLGSGLTFLDVSSATAAQIAALVTGPATGVTANAGNEIIVKNSVATTLSGPVGTAGTTFNQIKGFTALGVGGPAAGDGLGGVVNMANLPTTISTIDEITAASGALFINNQTAALTLNTFDNGGGFGVTVGLVGPAAGSTFNLIVGNTFHTGAGAVGTGVPLHTAGVRTIGDNTIGISSVGNAAAGPNTVGLFEITPALAGLANVTISGTHALVLGVTGDGAIFTMEPSQAAVPPPITALTNTLFITITNTGTTTFLSSANTAPNGFGDLIVPGDSLTGPGASGPAGGFPLTTSTNAFKIDATTSGGLIMQGGDYNFTPALTAAQSLGDTILGSTTGANVIGGSIGNDTLQATSIAPSNTIFTGGGKDAVTLGAGHASTDNVDIYFGFSTAGIVPGNAEVVRFHSITADNGVAGSGDTPQLGWFNQGTAVVATGYAGAAPVVSTYAGLGANLGTAGDVTTVNNFNPAIDLLTLADGGSGYVATGIGPAATNFFGGVVHGLVNGNLVTNPIAAGVQGTPATVQVLIPATVPGVADTVLAATNLILLEDKPYSSATDVATQLGININTIFFPIAGLGAAASGHIYVAWGDFGNQIHIGDAAWINIDGPIAGLTPSFAFAWHVSELATVPGVPVTGLSAATDWVRLMHN
jgi:hypothetical protein